MSLTLGRFSIITVLSKRMVDVSKIYKELNWKAKHTLREGLEKTIKWYKENCK